MSDKRNALAELADRIDVRKSTGTIVHIDASDLTLARRIIAELAKCCDCIHRAGTTLMYTPEERMKVISAVDNCRAIAEEGGINVQD